MKWAWAKRNANNIARRAITDRRRRSYWPEGPYWGSGRSPDNMFAKRTLTGAKPHKKKKMKKEIGPKAQTGVWGEAPVTSPKAINSD